MYIYIYQGIQGTPKKDRKVIHHYHVIFFFGGGYKGYKPYQPYRADGGLIFCHVFACCGHNMIFFEGYCTWPRNFDVATSKNWGYPINCQSTLRIHDDHE